MNSEIIRLAIGLNRIKDIIETQKKRNGLKTSLESKPNDFRVYYDLSLSLALSETKPKFRRKTAVLAPNVCPKWKTFTTICEDKRAMGVRDNTLRKGVTSEVKTSDNSLRKAVRSEVKMRDNTLRTTVTSEVMTRDNSLKKTVLSEVKTYKEVKECNEQRVKQMKESEKPLEEGMHSKQRNDGKGRADKTEERHRRESIERNNRVRNDAMKVKPNQQRKGQNEQRVKRTKQSVDKVQEMKKNVSQKKPQKQQKNCIEERVKEREKTIEQKESKEVNEKIDIIENIESKERVEWKAESIVEKALRDVPNWDELCDRVYARKALEVFPTKREDIDVTDESVSELQSEECEQLEACVEEYCRRMFECGPKAIPALELVDTKRTPFRLFIFDLCKEIVLNDFTLENELTFDLKIPLKYQKQFWPKTERNLCEIMKIKVKALLERSAGPRGISNIGLMEFCRQSRRRDCVDAVLYQEMRSDEWRWTHFEGEVIEIKERITQMIFNQLFTEEVIQWKRINSQSMC